MRFSPHQFIFGPWRAVPVLGVTQILAWGALFYPPVLTVPLIAADHGWSRTFAMGGFSLGLLVAGSQSGVSDTRIVLLLAHRPGNEPVARPEPAPHPLG